MTSVPGCTFVSTDQFEVSVDVDWGSVSCAVAGALASRAAITTMEEAVLMPLDTAAAGRPLQRLAGMFRENEPVGNGVTQHRAGDDRRGIGQFDRRSCGHHDCSGNAQVR